MVELMVLKLIGHVAVKRMGHKLVDYFSSVVIW
jgi:hypothetical protein